MTDNITGKTILLFVTKFYGYYDKMKEALLKLGAKEVIWIEMVQMKGSLRNRITPANIFFFLKNPFERQQRTKELIKKIGDVKIDVLLNTSCMGYNKCLLDYLRKKNPNIKMYFFHWDLLKTHNPRYFDYFPKFDKVYSFDRDDAKRYGFEYYPDFYIDGGNSEAELKYDLTFIGTFHNDDTLNRPRLIYLVDKFCKENNLKSFIYLRMEDIEPTKSPIKKLYRKVKRRKFNKIVDFYKESGIFKEERLTIDQVDKIFNESKVLFDVAHSDRQGMTLNCITALAKGKKLITANKRIVDEPFYDPANIYVIDEENPQLDMEFFNTPVRPVDMSYLRMDNWLRHIINQESVEELTNLNGGVQTK